MTKKSTLKTGTGVKLAAFRYNGGQLYTLAPKQGLKMVINVDWFSVNVGNFLSDNIVTEHKNASYIGSYRLGRKELDNGIRFELKDYGTKQFEKMYDMFLNGEHFATICTNVREGVKLDRNMSIIKINNDILYQRGWVARLEYIFSELKVTVNNITRLDIAVDGVNSSFLEQYKLWFNGKLEKTGKSSFTPHFEERNLTGGYVGKRSSERMIVIYRKSDELKKSGKNYIKRQWVENNMIESLKSEETVERIELSLSREAIRKIEN